MDGCRVILVDHLSVLFRASRVQWTIAAAHAGVLAGVHLPCIFNNLNSLCLYNRHYLIVASTF